MGSLSLALASAAVVAATASMLLRGDPSLTQWLLATKLPRAYASLLAWLTPPYLYFVLNAIILSIAASSRFHKPPAYPIDAVAPSPPPEMAAHPQELLPLVEHEEVLALVRADAAGEKEVEMEPEITAEKPPVSVRFRHRKNVKPTAEDKALRRVARPRREETLETTWRAITEGRAPLVRHFRKADTWETRVVCENEAAKPAAGMRKSETFSDGCAAMPPQGRMVQGRREASPGQEELNRRVEAFIKKFNEEMRLQRQLSLQQYMNMINRGSP